MPGQRDTFSQLANIEGRSRFPKQSWARHYEAQVRPTSKSAQGRARQANEARLCDERNFESLMAAGAPDDDEVVLLLPCDVEPLRAPVKSWIPRAIREAVLQRDGWTCQLCYQVIDHALRFPHPFSASIDHVVPRADGGPHQQRNLRAAHLRCNARRGRRPESAPLGGFSA